MFKTELKLFDDRVKGLLGYGSSLAAGIDLRACNVCPDPRFASRTMLNDDYPTYSLYPGEKVFVGSGIALHLASMQEEGSKYCFDEHLSVAALLLPRSGLGTKLDISLANTVGLIDADYQGEIIMAVKNGGKEKFDIHALDRLVQMMLVPVLRTEFTVVEEFSELSERGAGGFGSTGKV